MTRAQGLVAVVGLALLQGCGGGSADSAAVDVIEVPQGRFHCASIGGGLATIEAGCVSCRKDAIANPEHAIDMDLATPMVINTYHPEDLANQQTIITVKATAQKGVVFPAGSSGGIAIQLPTGTPRYNISVQTFLEGKLQSTHEETGYTHPEGRFHYVGFDPYGTSIPFDTVQMVLVETEPNLEEHVYRVLEICGDGGLN